MILIYYFIDWITFPFSHDVNVFRIVSEAVRVSAVSCSEINSDNNTVAILGSGVSQVVHSFVGSFSLTLNNILVAKFHLCYRIQLFILEHRVDIRRRGLPDLSFLGLRLDPDPGWGLVVR